VRHTLQIAAIVLSVVLASYPVVLSGNNLLVAASGVIGVGLASAALMVRRERLAGRLTSLAATALVAEYTAALLISGRDPDLLAPAFGTGLLVLIEVMDLVPKWANESTVTAKSVLNRAVSSVRGVMIGTLAATFALIAGALRVGSATAMLTIGVLSAGCALVLVLLKVRDATGKEGDAPT
jgi:hypothetical protein